MSIYSKKPGQETIWIGTGDVSFILDKSSDSNKLLDLWRYSREHSNSFDKIVFGDRTQRSTVKIEFHIHNLLKKILIDFTYKNNRLIIDKKVEFINIDFEDGLYCENITFKKNVYFHNCTFKKVLIKTCSLPCLLIKFGKISDNMEIIDIKSAKVTITQVRTTPDILLRIVNNLIILLSIDNFILQSWGEIKNSKIIKLSLENLTLNSNLIMNNTYFKCENWQTACILKNEELKRNNFVESLKYQAIEKKLYSEYLEDHKTLSNWADRFSLWLGGWFHNHGQNWVQAFLWTIAIIVLSFTCFYLPNPFKYWSVWDCKIFSGIYFSELFKYLVPTDYKQIQDYFIIKDLSFWTKFFGTFWYMLGKMVLPYGIFEVIKAFRKYK